MNGRSREAEVVKEEEVGTKARRKTSEDKTKDNGR
jgi:hypothetical protein